jgi:polysaccharide biosynthesis transport protein
LSKIFDALNKARGEVAGIALPLIDRAGTGGVGAEAPAPHTTPPIKLDQVSSEPAGYQPVYPSEYFNGPEGTGLIEYWRIIRRRKGVVLMIALAGLLVGVLITLPQDPVYQARTSLEIQDLNQEFMNLKQVSPLTDSSAVNALSDLQTQIKILQSDTLVDRSLAKLKIASPADLNAKESRVSLLRRALHLPEPIRTREEMLAKAARSMRIRAAGQTRIIEIMVDSTDPKLAASLANTVASEFIDQNMEARWQIIQRTGDWLGRQLSEMKRELAKSEDALQAYARHKGLIYTGEKQNVSEEKLHQLQAELSKAQADRVAKQSRYEITRTATAETLPDVLNDSNLRGLQASLTDLRRQEAELAANFKPDYSKVKKVRAQIVSLESALERERKTIVDRIGNDFEEAKSRETLFAAAYDAQARVVTQDSEKSIQYNILKREVDSNRQIYEAMLQRVKESSIASAMKASNIRVIDTAKIPRQPYKPSLPINAALGLLAGVMLGTAFVIMHERADRTIQDPGDAALFVGLSELGVIPNAEHPSKLLQLMGRRAQVNKANDNSGKTTMELITCESEPTFMTDSFRGILASLLFASENGSPRVIVITSTGPGEGKTTAASNLAIALAQVKLKVLLIDADLRKPSLHRIFELENETGLANLLAQRRLGEQSAFALVQETRIPNLHVLTSGTGDSANVLFSASMPALLTWYKRRYDMVIIDTPPMLHMPDARVIGRSSDAVVLVVRAGHTTRDAVLAARQRLTQDGTTILGVILNDWNPKFSPRAYYS